jgi:hypothetical protein
VGQAAECRQIALISLFDSGRIMDTEDAAHKQRFRISKGELLSLSQRALKVASADLALNRPVESIVAGRGAGQRF